MVKIYLSPSNQPHNKYCVGDTTEKIQMEDVAKRLFDILSTEYDCEVHHATIDKTIKADGRPLEAKELGCNVYFAIHSNACGAETAGRATGSMAFYHPDSAKGKEFAENLVAALNKICPIPSNRAGGAQSGMAPFDGVGYAEIREPSKYGLTAVLVETDFHDNPATAQWIIDNKQLIAQTYAEVLSKTFGFGKK